MPKDKQKIREPNPSPHSKRSNFDMFTCKEEGFIFCPFEKFNPFLS